MVYLLKMVIFHVYVSHNQMVAFSVLPSIPSDFPQCSCRKASIIFKNKTCSWGVTTWLTKMTKIIHPREVFSMTIIIVTVHVSRSSRLMDSSISVSWLLCILVIYPQEDRKVINHHFSKILLVYFFWLLYHNSFLWDSMKFSVRESRKFGDVARYGSFHGENDEYHGIRGSFSIGKLTRFSLWQWQWQFWSPLQDLMDLDG